MSKYFPEDAEMGRHTIFPGVHIRTAACEKTMMSVVLIEPGAVVAEHSHPHEQVGMILEGRAVFYIGDEERTLGPGDLYRIPGGVKHKVVGLEAPTRALDLFSPVREEYC
jgi:quercetin dioxygenase-like cupin family protein